MEILNSNSGIYCYENLINSKKYIGQSQDFNNRERIHLYFLNSKRYNDSRYFQNAWNKYGKENFKLYIIEECSIELLEEREKYWIKELHSHYTEWGYNISWGGKAFMRGRKHSKKSKKKMSLIQIGEKNSMYGRMAEKNPFYGKHHSEESIQKMVANLSDRSGENNSFFGKKHSLETIRKISNSKKGKYIGKNNPNFGKYGKNSPNFGKQHSIKSKEKMSVSRVGKKTKISGSSKYVGVYKRPSNMFSAKICYMRKQYYLGAFLTEKEAAIAYNLKARELYGINYDINKIDNNYP